MTFRELMAGKNMQVAVGAVVLGLLACGLSYYRATKVTPLPAPVPTGIAPGGFDVPPKQPDIDILAAVSADVFAPTRKAPPKRYRLPGEAIPATPREPSKPTVLGIGVTLDGRSFCACQLDFIYHPKYVGDTIGIYRVTSIERGRVVFTTAAGKDLEILVPRSGS